MNVNEIRKWVAKLESTRGLEREDAWAKLKPLGKDVLPYFLEFYPKMRKWQGRVSLLFHSIKFANEYDEAFKLGVCALSDRATLVRYRACMLLAYSQRKDAIKHLKKNLKHKDQKTVQDAEAAIEAIKKKNHHLFVDRDHTGQVFWDVNGEWSV